MSDTVTIKGHEYVIGQFTAKIGMRVFSTIVTAASLAAKADNSKAFLGYLQGADYDFVFDESLALVTRLRNGNPFPVYLKAKGAFAFEDMEDGGVTALKLVTAVLEKRITPFFNDSELFSQENRESDSHPALIPPSTPSSGVQ